MEPSPATGTSYAGFVLRFLALLVDSLILGLLCLPLSLLARENLAGEVISLCSISVLVIVYELVCIAHWGQTPGKMACCVKVVRTDGAAIGYRQSFLRLSPYVALTAVWGISLWSILPAWGDPLWQTGDYFARRETGLVNIDRLTPAAATLATVWFWAEVIVMRVNKQRRALHDLIAGTVAVVHRPGRGLGYVLDPRPGDPDPDFGRETA